MNNKAKNPTQRKSSNYCPRISKDTPVQYVKGVGPARAKLLERLGIKTLEDILFYLPWRYEDRKNLKKIYNLNYGNLETTLCEVVSVEVITTPKKKMKILELAVTDKTGYLKSKWFNQAYLKKYFKKGQKIILSGVVKGNPYSGIGLEMENPDFELLGSEDKFIHTSRIVPVYKATEGISPKQIRTLMFNTTNTYSFLIEDHLPEDILKRNNLKPLQWSIKEVHFPEECVDVSVLNKGLSLAHRRLVFDEFLLLELGLALLKQRETIEKGISFKGNDTLVNKFLQNLPFELTGAQKRVIAEIRTDMQKSFPMNRLVHGDVGCGKTIIALISMLIAGENGYQACLMAPSELLAEVKPKIEIIIS